MPAVLSDAPPAMLASLREALLRASPSVRAWLQLIKEGEARIVTYGAAGTDMPVLRTTVDLSGDVAFQVHRGHWNGLTSDGRTAIAAAHRASIATRMNLLVAPEAALRRVALVIRWACVVVAGGLMTGVLAMADHLMWAFGVPLLMRLLWKPAAWLGNKVIAHELRKFTG